MNWGRLSAGVGKSFVAASGAALFLMTLWTVLDVVTRYVLAKPLRGSIDLVESTMVLVVFLALPECLRRGEQVTVDVVDHLVGPRTTGMMEMLGTLATLVFLALLVYTGIQPTADALQFGDLKPDLPIPIAGLLGVILLALMTAVVLLLGRLVRQVSTLFKGGAP